ncbi:MAG: CehA/McbA family metallohydrolase [Thermoplasmata archaeon]
MKIRTDADSPFRRRGGFSLFRKALLLVVSVSMTVVLSCPLASSCVVSAGKPQAGETYNLYFGDLHTHTGYSDAYEDSTPWDAFQAAIDAGADFMAVTDHIAIWHGYDAWTMNAAEWADLLAAADYFTSKKFVAMAGYEAWLLGGCGEINVYNVRDLPPKEPLGYRFDRLPSFYDWLASQPGAVGQFNHPTYVSRDFMNYAFYSEPRDAGMNIIEVYNDEYYEDSYVMALDAGWHVMPSANSDTHYSDWISGHEMRTVLLAPRLTPEDLYAAMSSCRGYATLDKNLRIQFTLNGAVMGSTLASQTSIFTARITIADPDRTASDSITAVEIVSDGGAVAAHVPTSGTAVDLTITLTSTTARYYFVRVITASDHTGSPGVTAWTAPVWTGR